MRRKAICLAAVAALASLSSPVNAAPIHGDTAACAAGSGRTAVLVQAHGFRDRVGTLRLIVYRALEDEFLASGKYVARIDTPVSQSGDMIVCAALPQDGDYIVVLMHDRNANGKFNAFNDGVGFANNPTLGLSKPSVQSVKTEVKGLGRYSVVLNYMQGMRVGPLRSK